MYRIGVISDTHIPKKAKALPQIVLDYFKSVDTIFHLGDIGDLSVITELEKLAPVIAVAGNTDDEYTRTKLGEQKIIRIESKIFGLVHGHGNRGKTVERVTSCFDNDRIDCIAFGHSHNPYMEYRGKQLLFNPGSPTDKRKNRYFSLGILEVKTEIKPSIIYFDKNQVIQYP